MKRMSWILALIVAGCSIEPAPLLTVAQGHPGSVESRQAPFTPPSNPFMEDVAPTPKKEDGHEHHQHGKGDGSKEYPLDVCVVSGQKLGSMGKPVVLNHEGREVRLCCPNCVEDFKKDPQKYLKKLDEAEEKKPAEKQSEHHHDHNGGHP